MCYGLCRLVAAKKIPSHSTKLTIVCPQKGRSHHPKEWPPPSVGVLHIKQSQTESQFNTHVSPAPCAEPPTDEGSYNWTAMFVIIVAATIHFM